MMAKRLLLSTFGVSLLGGCAVGPAYHRPDLPVPVAFKEAAGWKEAQPSDLLPRQPWWESFNDPLLNELESGVAGANQTLREASANYEAERQIARAERATYWPIAGVSAGAQRGQARGSVQGAVNQFSVGGTASWTPDIFGRTRGLTDADIAAAQSSAAQLAQARLSIQSQLAIDYVNLRTLDARRRLLSNAVASYRRTLEIANNKYKAGVVARSDVITSQAQLDSTRAQVIDNGIQRAVLEHAIAVLLGKAPSEFSIASREEVGLAAPAVPSAVPSQLLERRPDVASAERLAAAANARIGVQVAAYYPDLTLTGSGGFQSSKLSRLISVPNRYWTLGANLAETLFDFGERKALVAEARANYDFSAAVYRQTVLVAFQQVEDDLASLRLLREEADVQAHAVKEATEAAAIAENEYRAGTVDYTTVVNAAVTELQNRETALQLQANQLNSSINLMQALGGGWTAADLPSQKDVLK
jgi:NodT family efflux transporter outer membrane factor (OMF) lipoprotein